MTTHARTLSGTQGSQKTTETLGERTPLLVGAFERKGLEAMRRMCQQARESKRANIAGQRNLRALSVAEADTGKEQTTRARARLMPGSHDRIDGFAPEWRA
jgi:hypothetical protein